MASTHTTAPPPAADAPLATPRRVLIDTLRAMRVHQWVKNVLLFVPLVTAHRLADAAAVGEALLGFVLFSLSVSGVYLINDLVDREADRLHPTKRRRPIAAGRMGAGRAIAMALGLIAVGLGIGAWAMPARFAALVGLYLVLSTAYTLALKRIVVVDVLMLAGFYAFRVVLGAAAIDVVVTPWLLAFSIFFFLSLAMAKRYKDLLVTRDAQATRSAGRGYEIDDLPVVMMMGTVSGYLSVLVLAMYIYESPLTDAMYAHPGVLWLLCPCLLYWMTRLWLITHRGKMDDDPVVFALRDAASWAVVLLGGIILAVAKFA